MKNKDLFKLASSIMACSSLKGVRFSYALSKNMNKIKSELKIFEEANQPSPEFKKFEEARLKLNKEFGDLDENGNLKMANGQYVILPQNRKKFDKAFEELKKKSKSVLKAREEQIKQFNELLEEESDFKPYFVNMEHVPEDISVEQLNGISDLIDDEGYEKA